MLIQESDLIICDKLLIFQSRTMGIFIYKLRTFELFKSYTQTEIGYKLVANIAFVAFL